MSVSNVILSESAVAIVADTCTYLGAEPLKWSRKVSVYPEARLAVSTRGLVWICRTVRGAAGHYSCYENAVPGLADIAATIIPEAAATHHGGRMDAGFEITVAGWRDGPKACRITYHNVPGFERVEVVDLAPGTHLAPSLGRQAIPGDITDDQVIRIAHLQQQVAVKHKLLMCIGGDIEAATVTADGATVRTIGTYPDRELTERRMQRTVAKLGKVDERSVAA